MVKKATRELLFGALRLILLGVAGIALFVLGRNGFDKLTQFTSATLGIGENLTLILLIILPIGIWALVSRATFVATFKRLVGLK